MINFVTIFPHPKDYLPNNQLAFKGYYAFSSNNYSLSIAIFTKLINHENHSFSKIILKNFYISRAINLLKLSDSLILSDTKYLIDNHPSEEIGYLLSFLYFTSLNSLKSAFKIYNLAKKKVLTLPTLKTLKQTLLIKLDIIKKPNLSNLPLELIFTIFDYLPFNVIWKCTRLSKGFNKKLIGLSNLWNKANFNGKANISTLILLSKRTNNLMELNLGKNVNISESSLLTFFKTQTKNQLKLFNLSNSYKLSTPIIFNNLKNHFENSLTCLILQKMDLSNCSNIIFNLKNLQELNLNYSKIIINNQNQINLPNLINLSLENIIEGQFIPIKFSCSILNLAYNELFTQDHLLKISNLKELNIIGCKNLTLTLPSQFIINNLNILKLGLNNNYNDELINQLILPNHQLKELTIEKINSITNINISNLNYLSLENCYNITLSCLENLLNLNSNLEYLNLNSLSIIENSNFLNNLPQKLPLLKHLILTNTKISNQSLQILINDLKNLEYINIDQCYFISSNLIKIIKQKGIKISCKISNVP